MTQAAALPNVGTPPVMVQPTASTSRVAMVGDAVRRTSRMVEMSVLARWQMRPRLMAIPGVSQVSIWGQRERQLQVQVDPQRLRSNNVTLTQLIETTGNALWVSPLSFVEASTPGTGGFVETPNQRHRRPARLADHDVRANSPTSRSRAWRARPCGSGTSPTCVEDHQPLIGDATRRASASLMLVVERFPDADVAQVTADVEEALDGDVRRAAPASPSTPTCTGPPSYLESALQPARASPRSSGCALMLLVVGLLTWSWRTALIAVRRRSRRHWPRPCWCCGWADAPLTTMTLLGLAAVTALVVDDVVGDVAAVQHPAPASAATAGRVAPWRDRRRGGRPRGARWPTRPSSRSRRSARCCSCPGRPAPSSGPRVLTFALAALGVVRRGAGRDPGARRPAARARRGGGAPGRRRSAPGCAGLRPPRSGRAVGRAVAGRRSAWSSLAGARAGRAARAAAPARCCPALEDRNVLVRLEAAPGTSLAEMDRITGTAAARAARAGRRASRSARTSAGPSAPDEVVDVDASEIWLTVADDADYDATARGRPVDGRGPTRACAAR